MRSEQDVRRWAKAARERTALRNVAIVSMRAEGATLRAIAAAAGLTHTAVAKIVRSFDESP